MTPLKQRYLYWCAIVFCSFLAVAMDTYSGYKHIDAPFIWAIFIIPCFLLMVMYPSWKVVFGAVAFYSFIKYTFEFGQGLEIESDEMVQLLISTVIEWAILLTVGHFTMKYHHLLRQVRALTFTDSLTGVRNRRYFDLFMEKTISLCKRKGHPLLLIIIDIDFFKRINDTYGHSCGDQALKHVANIVQRGIRASDVIVRAGGEEFIVVLPETSLDQGIIIAERIREVVENSPFVYDGEEIFQTISLGLSLFNGETIEEFIDKTDKALYQAKSNGRNQLVVWLEETCSNTEDIEFANNSD